MHVKFRVNKDVNFIEQYKVDLTLINEAIGEGAGSTRNNNDLSTII